MSEMKTITINGVTYTIADPDSATMGPNGNWWVGGEDTKIPIQSGAGKVTPEGGVVFGNELNEAIGEASLAAGDSIFRSGAEYVRNTEGKYYVESADCELTKDADVIATGYEVISLDALNNGTDTYVKTTDGGYCLKADIRYNEAVGSGSTANGMGAICFSRAGKSLGYRTQVGYPPSVEYIERRPELLYNSQKIADCTLSYDTEIASGINVSGMASVALQHHSVINVVSSNSSIVNFYIRFIFENESGKVGSFEYQLKERLTQTISCDVPNGATLLRIEGDRTVEIYRQDVFLLRNATLILYPRENKGQAGVSLGADNATFGNHGLSGGFRAISRGNSAIAWALNPETDPATGEYLYWTEANADICIAFGPDCHGNGYGSALFGKSLKSDKYYSFAANANNEALHTCATLFGYGNKSMRSHQLIAGMNAARDSVLASSYFAVGNGTSASPKTAFAVKTNGDVLVGGSAVHSGADYAEFFEWLDGNPDAEDRIGLVVALDGEKIRLAMPGDDVLGIVSGTAAVLGDSAAMHWKDKYLTDEFGRTICDMVEEFIEVPDPETGEMMKESTGLMPQPRLNPNYDPESTYIPREERKEWDQIGMMGKLYVRDDGTCSVGDYGCPGENGVLTKSDSKTNIRVMKRTSENIVLVLLK